MGEPRSAAFRADATGLKSWHLPRSVRVAAGTLAAKESGGLPGTGQSTRAGGDGWIKLFL